MKKTKNISPKKTASVITSLSSRGHESFQAIELETDSIIVEDRKRTLSLEKVTDLEKSIGRNGLIHPILVSSKGVLIAGLHRLAAYIRLDWKTIPAIIVQDDEMLNEQREIDEKLIRFSLTILERGEHHKRAKELEELRPNDDAGQRNNFAESAHYTQEAAERLNLSRRSIQQELRIASLLCQEVRDLLRDTPVADRKNDLLSFTRFSQEQQLALASIIKSGVKTLAAALRIYAQRDESVIAPQTFASEEATCIRAILKFATAGYSLEDIPDLNEAQAIIEKHKGLSINILRTLKSIILHFDSDDHLHSDSQCSAISSKRETAYSETDALEIFPEDIAINSATHDVESGTQLLPFFQDQPTI